MRGEGETAGDRMRLQRGDMGWGRAGMARRRAQGLRKEMQVWGRGGREVDW